MAIYRLDIKTNGGTVLQYDPKVVRALLRRVGGEVAARARSLIRAQVGRGKARHARMSTPGTAPVSRTGNLAKSIKVSMARGKSRVSIIDDARSMSGTEAAYYALFLEMGAVGGGGATSGRGARMHLSKSGKLRMDKSSINRTRVLAPHPFLSTALADVAGNNLGQRVADALVQGISLKRASAKSYK